MTYIIIQADESHVTQLEAIEAEGWPAGTRPEEPDPKVFGTRLPFEDLWIAVDAKALSGDEVLGYVAVGRRTPFPANDHVRVLRALVVSPAARRRGIGRALVQHAKEIARSQCATKLTLCVMSPNERARMLYLSEGFEIEAQIKGEYLIDGVLIDDYLMACWL